MITAFEYGKKAADAIMSQFRPTQLYAAELFAYYDGVFLTGLERIYEKTGERKYFDYIKEWVDSNIRPDGCLRETGGWASLLSLDFRRAGTLMFKLYEETGDERYWKNIEYLVESLKYYRKNEYGGFWHGWTSQQQMWLDGLYMAGPICAMYAAKTNKKEFYDIAVLQAEIMWDHARSEETGLLYHGWDCSGEAEWADPETGLSQEVWGRALGWYAVAICDILDYLPSWHPKRGRLIEMINTLLKTAVRYQDPVDGRWYEVIDKGDQPGNWHETSCSCLLVYALAKALRKGYLEPEYGVYARKGYEGIIANLKYDEDGRLLLTDICVGTAINSGTYEYYIARERCTNDLHGSGTFIQMCCQMDLWENGEF